MQPQPLSLVPRVASFTFSTAVSIIMMHFVVEVMEFTFHFMCRPHFDPCRPYSATKGRVRLGVASCVSQHPW